MNDERLLHHHDKKNNPPTTPQTVQLHDKNKNDPVGLGVGKCSRIFFDLIVIDSSYFYKQIRFVIMLRREISL